MREILQILDGASVKCALYLRATSDYHRFEILQDLIIRVRDSTRKVIETLGDPVRDFEPIRHAGDLLDALGIHIALSMNVEVRKKKSASIGKDLKKLGPSIKEVTISLRHSAHRRGRCSPGWRMSALQDDADTRFPLSSDPYDPFRAGSDAIAIREDCGVEPLFSRAVDVASGGLQTGGDVVQRFEGSVEPDVVPSCEIVREFLEAETDENGAVRMGDQGHPCLNEDVRSCLKSPSAVGWRLRVGSPDVLIGSKQGDYGLDVLE